MVRTATPELHITKIRERRKTVKLTWLQSVREVRRGGLEGRWEVQGQQQR